jgi:hypothetical protein
MNSDGAAKDDVKLPEGDLGKDIQAGFDDGKDLLVTIISAMNEEAVRLFPSLFTQSGSHLVQSFSFSDLNSNAAFIISGHLLQGSP